jgi:hypothetical protein
MRAGSTVPGVEHLVMALNLLSPALPSGGPKAVGKKVASDAGGAAYALIILGAAAAGVAMLWRAVKARAPAATAAASGALDSFGRRA